MEHRNLVTPLSVCLLALVEVVAWGEFQGDYDNYGEDYDDYLYPEHTVFRPRDCLDGRDSCRMDPNCALMLENLDTFCGTEDKPPLCGSREHDRCKAVQEWLQQIPGLEHCHCYVTSELRSECQQLHSAIYHNICKSSSGELFVEGNATSKRQTPLHTRPPHGRHRADIAYDEDGETRISCIGVRKECLLDQKCSQTLTDYRRLCRENKKKAECVTTEREECFKVLSTLRISGLFDCKCHMKRVRTREKCERIQSRVAQNTCLVTVPYLIHTAKSHATSYNELLSILSSSWASPLPADPSATWHRDTSRESTCVQAFENCNSDSSCQKRMASFMTACVWGKHSPSCDRSACLTALRTFYMLVKAEKTYPLLFCQCRHADTRCQAVRDSLFPTCSIAATPPPTCLDLLQRCNSDQDCRTRWNAYENACRYDKNAGGCSGGTEACRKAQVDIMGTIVTTNCTCLYPDDDQNKRCFEAKNRLQHDNVCKELSRIEYNSMLTTTPQPWRDPPVIVERPPDRQDCQRHLGFRIPSYMSIPKVIRMYPNDSDCSDLCTCLRNGTLSCKRLPCQSSALNCFIKNTVYIHGTTFSHYAKGTCRCIKSETVCAKPTIMTLKQRKGLFLHIGYSISDKNLLEDNPDFTFEISKVTEKLGALLNGDTAEQFCILRLYYQEEGHVMYQIKVSTLNDKSSLKETNCESHGRILSDLINSRKPVIVTDAALSILKVADVEMSDHEEKMNRHYRHNASSALLRTHLSWICLCPLLHFVILVLR